MSIEVLSIEQAVERLSLTSLYLMVTTVYPAGDNSSFALGNQSPLNGHVVRRFIDLYSGKIIAEYTRTYHYGSCENRGRSVSQEDIDFLWKKAAPAASTLRRLSRVKRCGEEVHCSAEAGEFLVQHRSWENLIQDFCEHGYSVDITKDDRLREWTFMLLGSCEQDVSSDTNEGGEVIEIYIYPPPPE